MVKSWVVVKFVQDAATAKAGAVKAWRTYSDDYVWGSALYEVIGYYDGSHKDALAYGYRILGDG